MSLKLTRRNLFAAVFGALVARPLAKLRKPISRLRGRHYTAMVWDEAWPNTVGESSVTFENVWKAIKHFERQKPATIVLHPRCEDDVCKIVQKNQPPVE